MPGGSLSIAIVGVGPRGLSVLERLLIRLHAAPIPGEVVIWAIDPVEHGSGRIWRTDQPSWLAANATAAELTVHSPDSYLLPTASSRPYSLADWTAGDGGSDREADDCPSRNSYGRYLHEVFELLCRSAPTGVRVHPVLGQVTSLVRSGRSMRLCVDHGRLELQVDKVVLATGHSSLEPTEEQLTRIRHTHRHPGSRCLGPGIAAEMPLDDIQPSHTVAVQGLGLTFYDVVRSLSLGRDGRFVRQRSGQLRYIRSGHEPHIVAGSRSGLPFLARARTLGPPQLAPRPVVLTEQMLCRLRADAKATRGTEQLDFSREVEPIIRAEIEHAYYRCAVHLRCGVRAAGRFCTAFQDAITDRGALDPDRWAKVLAAYRVDDLPGARFDALARPFTGLTFTAAGFRHRLLEILRADVTRARAGSAVSPVKAALETLRSLRPALPWIVDFGGLLPRSQQDFLHRFAPMSFLLSAGPPASHVEQLVALIEAGVVEVAGPAARFTTDDRAGRFVVSSPRVSGSRQGVDVLLDARAPGADLWRDRNPLLQQLRTDGLVSEFVNTDPITGARFATGGLAVTRTPFHVIDSRGDPDPDIYAIGVVTQNTRWFTQVGTGRPGQGSPFCQDADTIALHVLGHRAANRDWSVAV